MSIWDRDPALIERWASMRAYKRRKPWIELHEAKEKLFWQLVKHLRIDKMVEGLDRFLKRIGYQ